MKKIFLLYAFWALVTLAILSLLSYSAGSGYVYILWHGVQIQSNIWVLIYGALIFSCMMHLIWLLYRRYLSQSQRQLQEVSNFDALHPYEQLGVIWLLDADDEQPLYIEKIFENSGLLSHVVQARILSRQGFNTQALSLIEQCPDSIYELAQLQKIEVLLVQDDAQSVLTHLEALSTHQLSPWLMHFNRAYQQRVEFFWAQLALKHPWEFLNAQVSAHLDADNMRSWLTQLLSQFDVATPEQLIILQQKYLKMEDAIKSLPFEIQVLWLKLLARISMLPEQLTQLALHLLDLKFDQEVFYLWFQQQLLLEQVDYLALENRIVQLELRYPSLPVLSFANWHIYTLTKRFEEAEQLLSLYPDNILMSYLRIRANLNKRPDLVEQLKLVFENDAKFIELKI